METLLTVDDINKLIRNPVTWVVLVWIGRELWRLYREKGRELDKAIKENILKMGELTIAIVRLETKIENLEKLAGSVPKIQSDVNTLYSKLRQGQTDQASTSS